MKLADCSRCGAVLRRITRYECGYCGTSYDNPDLAINTHILGHKRADYVKQTVAALGQQLSWTHIRELLPLESAEARKSLVRRLH